MEEKRREEKWGGDRSQIPIPILILILDDDDDDEDGAEGVLFVGYMVFGKPRGIEEMRCHLDESTGHRYQVRVGRTPEQRRRSSWLRRRFRKRSLPPHSHHRCQGTQLC